MPKRERSPETRSTSAKKYKVWKGKAEEVLKLRPESQAVEEAPNADLARPSCRAADSTQADCTSTFGEARREN